MAAALSRVYAGLCRRDRLTSKECPFWFYSLFCAYVYASTASLPAVYFVAGLPQILCLAVYRNIFQGKMMNV